MILANKVELTKATKEVYNYSEFERELFMTIKPTKVRELLISKFI